MITLEQAKKLKCGDWIHHVKFKNTDGTPARFRINGKVKTWKRNTEKIQIPIKRGLWEFGYLTESNLHEFNLGGQ